MEAGPILGVTVGGGWEEISEILQPISVLTLLRHLRVSETVVRLSAKFSPFSFSALESSMALVSTRAQTPVTVTIAE